VAAFEAAGGYEALARHDEVLRGVGLAGLPASRPVGSLSGGQKTRLGLARLLAEAPDVLLLDEPTNHLDVEGLEWLENYLAAYKGSVVVVSHDRTFLDNVATTILALDGVTRTVTTYAGGYSDYVAAREAARAAQAAAYLRQEKRIVRLEEDVRAIKGRAMAKEQATQNDFRRARAKSLARRAVTLQRRLERQLDSEEHLEKPAQSWSLKLDLAADRSGARDVLAVRDVSFSYSEAGAPVLRGASLSVRHGDRLIVTGPNGGGKSTLVRLIAGELHPQTGEIRLGSGVRLGYFAQEETVLDALATPLSIVRGASALGETEARSFLHLFLFSGDDVFTPVSRLSYGERARLVLARLVLGGANLLLLDEPLNHLDIPSRERFEKALDGFPGTIIAVLHDRAAIARLANRVVELRDGRLIETAELPA
jgi:ATP-binding cassette subfamily F protein 3